MSDSRRGSQSSSRRGSTGNTPSDPMQGVRSSPVAGERRRHSRTISTPSVPTITEGLAATSLALVPRDPTYGSNFLGLIAQSNLQVARNTLPSGLFDNAPLDLTAINLTGLTVPVLTGPNTVRHLTIAEWAEGVINSSPADVLLALDSTAEMFTQQHSALMDSALVTQAIFARLFQTRADLDITRISNLGGPRFSSWRQLAASGRDTITRKRQDVDAILSMYAGTGEWDNFNAYLTDPISPGRFARLGKDTISALRGALKTIADRFGNNDLIPFSCVVNAMDYEMVKRLHAALTTKTGRGGRPAFYWRAADAEAIAKYTSQAQFNVQEDYMSLRDEVNFRIPKDEDKLVHLPQPMNCLTTRAGHALWVENHPRAITQRRSSTASSTGKTPRLGGGPSPQLSSSNVHIDRDQYQNPEDFLQAHAQQQWRDEQERQRQTVADVEAARANDLRRSDRLAGRHAGARGGLAHGDDGTPDNDDDEDADFDAGAAASGSAGKRKGNTNKGATPQACTCNKSFVPDKLKGDIKRARAKGASQTLRYAIFNNCTAAMDSWRNSNHGGHPFCQEHLGSVMRLVGMSPAYLTNDEKARRIAYVAAERDIAKLKCGNGRDPSTWQWFEKDSRPAHPSERLGPYKFVPTATTRYWKISKSQQGHLRLMLFSNVLTWANSTRSPYDVEKQWVDDGSIVLPRLFSYFDNELPTPLILGGRTYTTLWDILETELASYSWHQRTEEHLGWLRTSFFSLVQMVIRQDPMYWALYVATRNDCNHWLIAYPYYMKFATDSDQTKFRHIDLNVKNLTNDGIGDGQVQGSASLDDEVDTACTELLMGMHRDGNLEKWWKSLIAADRDFGDQQKKKPLSDGLVQAIYPPMWTSDHERQFGTKFVPQPVPRFGVRLSQPHLPHGALQMKGGDTKIRRTVFPWFQGIRDDHHSLEFPKGGTYESVSMVYSTLDPGSNDWLTASGLKNNYARTPYTFPGTVPFYACNPISEALLGRRRWDMQYMADYVQNILVNNPGGKNPDVDSLAQLRQDFIADVNQQIPRLFKQIVAAEKATYGSLSFYRALETGVCPGGESFPSDWRTSHFNPVQGSSRSAAQHVQANLAEESGWMQRASGSIAEYRPEAVTQAPSNQIPGNRASRGVF